jgi:hypothetical protein
MASFEWVSRIVQRIRYRGAVAMLTVALLSMIAVLGVIAARATAPAVQITLSIVAAIAVLGFFGTVMYAIKRLGVYALLETNQMISYWRMAAKGVPSIPDTPSIPDPKNPKSAIDAAPDTEDR